MIFGDLFESLIPEWIRRRAKGCKCSDTKHRMNLMTAEHAEKSWSKLEFQIYANAKTVGFLGVLPRKLVIAAIRRRLRVAFYQAFGRQPRL